MDGKIKIELEKREDKHGKIYYIGKTEAPITIDCEKGIAFLVFVSDDGNEELHICNLENNNKNYKIKQPQVFKTLKKNHV